MKSKSSLLIVVLAFSIDCRCFAQQGTANPRLSGNKADTVKVSLVNSIPLEISLISDPAMATRDDTLKVIILNPPPEPTKWQYAYYYITTNNEQNADTPDLAFLNDRGAEGWELVSISFIRQGRSLAVFKRPL